MTPIQLLVDTDVGNDVDDLLALGVLLCEQAAGRVTLDGVCSSKNHDWSAPFARLFLDYFGCGCTVGVPSASSPLHGANYLNLLPFLASSVGRPIPSVTRASSEVISEFIEQATEGATMLCIGFSTNLAEFLADDLRRKKFNSKVNRIVFMAGSFSSQREEFNIKSDVGSFRDVLQHFAGEAYFCSYELGRSIVFPHNTIYSLYNEGVMHPLWMPYFSYKLRPHDRPCYDPVAALFAARPSSKMFSLSPPGVVMVSPSGAVQFRSTSEGRHRLVGIDPEQIATVQETLINLISTDLRKLDPYSAGVAW